ncbi:unnamed protein product [Prorocentrum cordatum]|uniref:Mannosyltransferase n=1 Tax=Prorocentrum cordatum TaxID=2364126 RepID=A0ABN9SQL5_9DINO|nr:unnamed protein product [Polarella glacialis]
MAAAARGLDRAELRQKKKGGLDSLPLCLAGLVLSVVFLSTAQMMFYLRADTTHALHFVAGESGVPGLVWNGSHHVQTKAHSVEFGAAPALRGRSRAALAGASAPHGEASQGGRRQCHLGGPFGGFIPGCSKVVERRN